MKELTLKEVISIIKEGETWENQDLIVYLSGNELNIDWKDEKPDKGIVFNIDDVFVLQRNKVSFSEAFKAYEEGKEIESCVSGWKYKIVEEVVKIDTAGNEIRTYDIDEPNFSTIEINEKWYIN